MRGSRFCPALLAAVLLFSAGGASGADDPADWILRIRETALDPDHAVSVRDLRVNLGAGTLVLHDGTLFPTTPVGGKIVEVVFLGNASLRIEAPDEIEAGQLELFTGGRVLDEPITEAVLVVCMDAASRVLFSRPAPEALDSSAAQRAELLLSAWRNGPERKLLDVEAAILMDALGDPLYATYFAGRFHSEELGWFLWVVEPDAAEQIGVVQFQPFAADATEKQKREGRKALHREKRRGRFVGFDLEDLGRWDSWYSASLRTPDGEPFEGFAAFEPEHYTLGVSLDESGKEISGEARLQLVATTGGRRFVRLAMHPDYSVETVRDGEGHELYHLRGHRSTFVALRESPAAGERVELELRYRGVGLEKIQGKLFRLRETRHWYPHVGDVDRATYEVTLRWPRKFDLVAAGKLVDSGVEGQDRRWEKRVIEIPSAAFSFELGRFEIRHADAGPVRVTVAFDREASKASDELQDEILETVTDSLTFYEEVFGPYPLDYLTVVTVPRDFSQGLLGFVSLSTALTYDLGWFATWLGIEDRRTVVAHEIAHQWWGNLVGWMSYRDQWISEAMANYAAMAWARRRLPEDEQPRVGPESNWQDVLTVTTEDGRVIESLGPLVLGGRLDSSRSSSAYETIVYKKGAVVLNMLGNAFGEDAFLESLHALVALAAGKVISTGDFLTALEAIAGVDLDWFARQYIYGTGIPQVYYRYEFEPGEPGKWAIRLEAEQQAPFHYRYSVLRREDGSLDVAREAEARIDVEESSLIVPFQVAVHNPDAENESRSGKSREASAGDDAEREPNSRLHGRLSLQGRRTELRLEIDYEPHEFRLDPERKVFGQFYSEELAPKRMLAYRAYARVAAGDYVQAEELLSRALQAEVSADADEASGPEARRIETEGEVFDAWIHLQLATIHLEQRRVELAREEIEAARSELRADSRRAVAERLKILEARLDLAEGEPDKALKRLRGRLRGRDRMASTDGYVVLAIAARAAGDEETFELAAREATDRGAELSALTE